MLLVKYQLLKQPAPWAPIKSLLLSLWSGFMYNWYTIISECGSTVNTVGTCNEAVELT